MTPSAPPGLLSEGEVREALARVRAFVERHPRRNESILRRLDDAVSVLAPEAAVVDAPQATLVADTTDGITDTITGTDAAVEVLDQAAEARIARTEGVTARWRLRAARDLGRDAVRALGAGVLVSQEERTSAASHTAHAHHGPQSHHGAPGYEQSNDRCARRNRASDGSDGGKTGQG
jgi:hypothetical protein